MRRRTLVGWASGDVHRQVNSLRVTGGRERQQTNKQTNGQTHTEREQERGKRRERRGKCPTATTDVNGSMLTAATLQRSAR